MNLDYSEIGRRIAKRRKQLNLKQSIVEERADIERGFSIPSLEVIMRLAKALDTTPDEFLVGTARVRGEAWRNTAEYLRTMNEKQLEMADSFLRWLLEQDM